MQSSISIFGWSPPNQYTNNSIIALVTKVDYQNQTRRDELPSMGALHIQWKVPTFQCSSTLTETRAVNTKTLPRQHDASKRRNRSYPRHSSLQTDIHNVFLLETARKIHLYLNSNIISQQLAGYGHSEYWPRYTSIVLLGPARTGSWSNTTVVLENRLGSFE